MALLRQAACQLDRMYLYRQAMGILIAPACRYIRDALESMIVEDYSTALKSLRKSYVLILDSAPNTAPSPSA